MGIKYYVTTVVRRDANTSIPESGNRITAIWEITTDTSLKHTTIKTLRKTRNKDTLFTF